MRLAVLTASVIIGLAAPVLACPPIEACLVNLKTTTRTPRSEAQARTTTSAVVSVTSSLDLPLLVSAPPKRASGEVEVPWIWRVLRERVYNRMPSYQRDRDDLKVVLAPVVVTSPSDTVPGLGIAGAF